MGQGSGFGEISVSCQAVRAQVVVSGIACKTDAAAGTAGMGRLADLTETGEADPGGSFFISPIFSAKGTAGWEEKINQGMPPGGHF
jgi:hypothetical protein